MGARAGRRGARRCDPRLSCSSWATDRSDDRRAKQAERLEDLRFVRSVAGTGTPERALLFSGIDLVGQNLSGLDLQNAELNGAELGAPTSATLTSTTPRSSMPTFTARSSVEPTFAAPTVKAPTSPTRRFAMSRRRRHAVGDFGPPPSVAR